MEVLAGNTGVVVDCYRDMLVEAAVGVLSKNQAVVVEPEEYFWKQPFSISWVYTCNILYEIFCYMIIPGAALKQMLNDFDDRKYVK